VKSNDEFTLSFYILVAYVLHNCPYKQRYIAGAAKWFIKPFSKILIAIFTAVKTGLLKYHAACFSGSGNN
jgi:hypothetical protein